MVALTAISKPMIDQYDGRLPTNGLIVSIGTREE
jgi:hypothetical protein